MSPPESSASQKSDSSPSCSIDTEHLCTKCGNHTHQPQEKSPESNPDFATIKIVSRIVIFILKKCWMVCGASILVIFVIHWYFGGFSAFCLLLFALSALLYQLSDWLLYHPDQPPNSRIFVPAAAMFGLNGENVQIKTKDGVLIRAILIKQDSSAFSVAPTLVYFHGNAGNLGHRLPIAQGFYNSCGCNVLLVEYRGYGHSEGTPSEEGLYLDAQAALQYLVQHPMIDHRKIIIYGQSLGGAVAIDLTSHSECAANIMLLVVENTFTTIPDIAKILFSWRIIHYLPTWCYKNQFKSISKIRKVKVPTLFLSGLADSLIPSYMMKELYQAVGSNVKRLILFESGTHNDTWICNGYFRAINLFFDDVMMLSSHDKSYPKQEVCLLIPANVL